MPSRPDIRELASNVRDAFSDMDREALLDVLSFVLKEYVVEGPPPMLVHQAETLSDLQGATFAQLITQMQTRFDFPELSMFVVDGDQVSVRVGGVVHPLLAQRQPLGEPTGRTQTPAPPPQPGVRVIETTLAQRPPPAAAPQAPAQYIDTRPAAAAPPPVRGISLRGAPTGGSQAAAPQPAPAAPSATPPAAAAAPEKSDKPEGTGDDASARFSLLELD